MAVFHRRSLTAEQNLREAAQEMIVGGFTRRDDVLAAMFELAADPEAPIRRRIVDRIVTAEWERRAEQLRAPAVRAPRTPSDDVRFAAAFARVAEDGVLASMNLGYTQSDAIEESLRSCAGREDVIGFAYFTEQDAARLAIAPATLPVGFGAVGEFPDARTLNAASVRVAQAVRTALVAEGLTAEWDGSSARRIAVVGVDWRRPLPE